MIILLIIFNEQFYQSILTSLIHEVHLILNVHYAHYFLRTKYTNLIYALNHLEHLVNPQSSVCDELCIQMSFTSLLDYQTIYKKRNKFTD